jgi:RNA polymerase sigma factor (sigma-70 family)
MLPAKQIVAIEPVVTAIRKMEPRIKPPVQTILKTLSEREQATVKLLMSEMLEYVWNPAFASPGFALKILGPIPAPAVRNKRMRHDNNDSGVFTLGNGGPPPFAGDAEHRIFLKLNYCRYRLMGVLEEFAGRRLNEEALREALRWHSAAIETRDAIVQANVPLVLAMAKRTRITGVDFSDLISEGNLALLRAVDKFDCSRGFKFSTYACRAILKSFSRVAGRAARHRGYFPTEFDPTLEKSDFQEIRREEEQTGYLDELKSILSSNLAKLNEVEQRVIRMRFALDDTGQGEAQTGRTLEQVGELIGVTKERVRQIQNKALGKLRDVLSTVVDR